MKYPWRLLPQLSAHVESWQRDKAHAVLDDLLAHIRNQRRSLAFKRLRCSNLMIGCTRGSHRAGVPSETVLDGFYESLERLLKARTWTRMKTEMHRYVDACLNHTKPVRLASMEAIVARIRSHMRRSLESPRTLEQYADIHRVSRGHLSTAFKRYAGISFRDELRGIRIKRSCDLLRRTSLKISTIARKVGLRDPSQFVADFRRDLGVTPGVYRKNGRRRRDGVLL